MTTFYLIRHGHTAAIDRYIAGRAPGTDLTDEGRALYERVVQHLAGIQLATGLARNEVSVETVEHLLAALVSTNIDNVHFSASC